ncbi:hypothetical protein LTS18_004609 [Coniosporium uncinatum]|uniref:Uncharacterized protein n=1 Tax=Coniosporium uncinatum TaxID=93489 RepID=A0ACC3D5P2_9PEZI|nr:hypothetical protein LTS18_004609 [Coniosporium uncinatum]
MSLYYEAAALLTNPDQASGSFKSRIFGKKDLKSNPAQTYALIVEATKWSAVLKGVIERAGVLKEERKLTPILALLLSHDLLLSKGGVAAPKDHVLKLAISRHKARLAAELTKERIKRGFGNVDALRAHVNAGGSKSEDGEDGPARVEHPRWARVNRLKTTLEESLGSTFAGYKKVEKLNEVLQAAAADQILHADAHIPDLIALPPRYDLSTNPAYLNGEIILQDKASCFPAYLLNVQAEDRNVIDACAAPGNKTTHLASFLHAQTPTDAATQGSERTVFAFERDGKRSEILKKMVTLADGGDVVKVQSKSDFLRADPFDKRFSNVTALLLDPSCSGSGIVGRDDVPTLHLPEKDAVNGIAAPASKKRKRKTAPSVAADLDVDAATGATEEQPNPAAEEGEKLKERLEALSAFQLKLLLHAMKFPAARKITYSTCSVHAEENEYVVLRALASAAAREAAWKILKRGEQVDGMKRWAVRGDGVACSRIMEELAGGGGDGEQFADDVAEACIRCEKGTKEGTMGFFVAGFVRDVGLAKASTAANAKQANGAAHVRDVTLEGADGELVQEEEEEWRGFSGDEEPSAPTTTDHGGNMDGDGSEEESKRK